ncbi:MULTISPECIES: hypothetical protein [unclassified Aeromicrobium]|uniref:hypothetical protein n=1 Tax=unclassified Aeromicrobium TaxID=2633570 RepID=UPI00288BF031|nr:MULTISPECIES: hypothetical protein [unclassified Aeromicrobium]
MENTHTRVAINDPELGVIVVMTADDGTTTTGAGDGWEPTPAVAMLLRTMRHARPGAPR